MISHSALRPRPSAVFTRICVTTASRLCERKLLVCSRSSTGSASMMRSMVLTALVVCSVPSTRCPVSAAVIAMRDRLGIAQLADQDHVRVLAHGRAHAFGEARDVGAQLALDHLAVLAAMNELDRVLEADDVEPAGLVEVIDHRRKRGRLAGAGGAGHQHHALVVVAQLGDDRRQGELLKRRHLGWDGAEGGADAGLLAEHVDAKAPAIGGHIGEVQVARRVRSARTGSGSGSPSM